MGNTWRRGVVLGLLGLAAVAMGENWPMWRGPRLDGTSSETQMPVRWSATENVRWKTPIPGKGHASPIVWEDRIFVVTCDETTKERLLLCLGVEDGHVLWQRTVLRAPLERIHPLNSRASSTPATDGQRVYVSFLDEDEMFVAAYDFSGRKVWETRPGPFASMHGYCSSPILWRGKVIVNGDHDGPAYLVALDAETGRVVWKTPRPNNTRSYCVPIIERIDGRNQMILAGSKCVASYDPDTGEQHWIVDGPTEQFVASLVYNGKQLFLTCGFPDRYMLGIRPNGRGNVTRTHELWRRDEDCSYVPSPIAFGPYFLVVSDTGVASCLRAEDGGLVWRQRLRGRHSASLVSAGGLVYFLSDRGRMTVVRPGPTFEAVAVNEIGERTNASPAISNGRLFLRGDRHLFCISLGSARLPDAQASGPEAQTAPKPTNTGAAAHTVETLAIGSPAPDFSLPGVDGRIWSLRDFSESPLLMVVFTANHCPTAQAYEQRIMDLVRDYGPRGLALVAISPNDPKAVRLDELGYSDMGDSFEEMRERARQRGFNFPYLYDGETQAVSRAYGPRTTPHVFLFDRERKLRYVGRIDDNEHIGRATVHDARNAIEALLAGREVPVAETNTFGCSIKWRDKRQGVARALERWAKEPVGLETIGLDGIRSLLANDSKKLRMVNFWATWCGPCVSEFDDLVEIHRMYRNRDFELITVSADKPARRENVLAFLEKHQASCRNLIYGDDDVYELIDTVGRGWKGGIPFTLLIRPGGEVVGRYSGAIDPAEVKRAIVEILGRTYP